MSIYENIQNFIDNQAAGHIFTFRDIDAKNAQIVTNILNIMFSKKLLSKVKKGYFYKIDVNTPALPTLHEMLSAFIDWDLSYYTGLCAYAKLNLIDSSLIKKNRLKPISIATTEKQYKKIIPTVTVLGRQIKVPYQIQKRKINTHKIDSHIALILDTIKDLPILISYNKNIYNDIHILISKLSDAQKNTLIDYSIEYEPSTKAILGSIFDLSGNTIAAQKIHSKLHTMSEYTVDFDYTQFDYKYNWCFKKRSKPLKVQNIF
jgi:hypothetical protein